MGYNMRGMSARSCGLLTESPMVGSKRETIFNAQRWDSVFRPLE